MLFHLQQHSFYIYSFLVLLGLCCRADFSLVAVSGGYPLFVMHGLVIAAASLVAEHGLKGLHASAVAVGELSSCSSLALEHRLNGCGTPA